MICVEAKSADSAWRQLVKLVNTQGKTQASRDQPTKEILHVGVSITEPRQRIVFARPMNPAFAIVETISILAGINDVNFMAFWNPRMLSYSDDGSTLNGAYGYRFGCRPRLSRRSDGLRHWNKGTDQLRTALEALKHSPDSRQVVLQSWDKDLDMPNGSPRSKDVPCNLVSHLLIREGKLNWLQVFRSNDLFWGLPYNFVEFTAIQEIMAGWLGVELGEYNHISNSLHAYQRHWNQMNDDFNTTTKVPENSADLRIYPYDNWESIVGLFFESIYSLTEHESVDELLEVRDACISSLPMAYAQWMNVLTAEALRRWSHQEEADRLIVESGEYWRFSWKRWASQATRNLKIHSDLQLRSSARTLSREAPSLTVS